MKYVMGIDPAVPGGDLSLIMRFESRRMGVPWWRFRRRRALKGWRYVGSEEIEVWDQRESRLGFCLECDDMRYVYRGRCETCDAVIGQKKIEEERDGD